MKCFNDNLLPAVQAIPSVVDRAETELVEEEVREEVEVEVKESLQTLGLEVGASEKEIKKKFRVLALQYHSENNEEGQKEINRAYDLLSNQ